MNFNYPAFRDKLVQALESYFSEITQKYTDIYAFSLDCTGDVRSIGVIANTTAHLAKHAQDDDEDFPYYQYCEAEWAIFHTFKNLSEELSQYLETDPDKFTNPHTYIFTDSFHEHAKKVTASCDEALIRFKASELFQKHPNIMLNFVFEDDSDKMNRVARYRRLNGTEAAYEFEIHYEDFA